ncbi:hypothetical protein SLE39_004991, partial [Salmonella enterica]|nr:hypothetical protein [Salmonella enterica]ELW4599952.1 hypothetical protein [Salmonella enterica]ELX8744414.1 hypothetical protein [Salmonella enterica]
METYLNTWLMGFAVETSGVEMMVYHLVSAETPELAEAGAMMMGRTWWENGKTVHEGYSWRWPHSDVWFNNIVLLDDVENSILRGLKFPDAWTATGAPDAPVLRDEWGNDWRDIT